MQSLKQIAHTAILMKAAIGSERLALERSGHKIFQKEFGAWIRKQPRSWSKATQLPGLEKIMRQIYLMAYEWGALQTLESLGFNGKLKSLIRTKSATTDVAFSLRDKDVIDAIDSHIAKVAADVADTTITTASTKLSDVLRQGGSVNEAREDIREYLGESVAGWRSYLIVNTEFQAGIGKARHDVFEKSGGRKKFWQTVEDERVREEHRANQRQGWIDIDERWQSGDLFPGDVTPYGCRCVEELDLDDNDVVLQAWDGS